MANIDLAKRATKERTTQALLAAVAVLLVAHLFRPASVIPAVQAASQKTPDVLRAQGFELVDKEGKVVAQLHVGEDGGGNIRLRSGDGMVRVKLGATADGSALLLFDKEAEPALWLASNKSETSATLAQKGKAKKVFKP
jgi:hypothetical protein